MRWLVCGLVLAIPLAGCLRDEVLLGPDSERFPLNALTALDVGWRFTGSSLLPEAFAIRDGSDPHLQAYHYKKNEERFVGPQRVDLFRNDQAGLTHGIAILSMESGNFAYIGIDFMNMADGRLILYFADPKGMDNAKSWAEIKELHRVAANGDETVDLAFRTVSADERVDIVGNSPPLAGGPNDAPPDMSGMSCAEIRAMCDGRLCRTTADGRRLYKAVGGDLWYFADGRIASAELWINDTGC